MNKYLIRGFGLRSNLYWTGCGWTEFEKTANRYSEADGEQVIAKMYNDKIMGELVKCK